MKVEASKKRHSTEDTENVNGSDWRCFMKTSRDAYRFSIQKDDSNCV